MLGLLRTQYPHIMSEKERREGKRDGSGSLELPNQFWRAEVRGPSR